MDFSMPDAEWPSSLADVTMDDAPSVVNVLIVGASYHSRRKKQMLYESICYGYSVRVSIRVPATGLNEYLEFGDEI